MKDIHTHKPFYYPEGVVNLDIKSYKLHDLQKYSIGVHPWLCGNEDTDHLLENVKGCVYDNRVVAIGECGIDLLRGEAPVYEQMMLFKQHIELSELVEKPLIIHQVKAHEIVVGLRRDYRCSQPWVIHGFRGKPTVAKMLLDVGCHLSFGERFNAETLKMVPEDRILAETDESTHSIDEIIAHISAVRGKDMTPVIEENMHRVLG
jgi:TatD DNase family protein